MTDKITIERATVEQVLEVLEKLNNTNSYWWQEVDKELVEQLGGAESTIREALAEQPAQQEPVAYAIFAPNGNIRIWSTEPQHVKRIAEENGMSLVKLYTSPPASKPWVPVTQELLHKQHPWLYEPMWIAMKDGSVIQGHYEWRQGWNPDRFIAEGFNHWAFDAAYVMPVIKPTPPAIEATIGTTGEQK